MNFFTTKKAAQKLGISRSALMKEILDGNITFHKRRSRYVFMDKDLEEYIEKNKFSMKETKRIGNKNISIEELKKACPNIKWKGPVYHR